MISHFLFHSSHLPDAQLAESAKLEQAIKAKLRGPGYEG